MTKSIPSPVASKSADHSDHRFGRVSTDLVSPRKVEAVSGNQYALRSRDDFSRFTWAHPIRQKLDVPPAFKRFLADLRAEGDIERLRTDGGGECISED